MQRAVYLCACGESPDKTSDWYNFLIDRIQNITPLTVAVGRLPHALRYTIPYLFYGDDSSISEIPTRVTGGRLGNSTTSFNSPLIAAM